MSSMLPYGGAERDKPLFRVNLSIFSVVIVCLPLIGFFACITLSILYHYNEATYTHCQVNNYLPSVSAAISLTPERYIWRFCIGLHSAPRLLISTTYFNFYRGRFARQTMDLLLSVFTFFLALTENIGLLLLTYVCSTENYSLHKYGFITFVSSSLLHMLCTCKLWRVISKYSLSSEDVTSYRYKFRLFLFSICCCGLAAYFFRRHNKYCEPGRGGNGQAGVPHCCSSLASTGL
ncbi:post-GPI attachment to proteins factor 2 isoform X2 [Trichomycterus rosablanca]|uniref:post-GPI attachment to proteins factor 2 isoform X2 n=1 Tax=Trichomycterus rosablanca TaxID=2290929 RepID=UPI002F3545BE